MKTNYKTQIDNTFKKVIALFIISFLFSVMGRAQERVTMNVKDLDSDIEKYVEKNYKEYKTVEAFKYQLVYSMKIQKDTSAVRLVFDGNGKFLRKATEADKAKVALQTRTTISLDDVESDISKYIKKNYEGYKLTEAYRYDEVYAARIMKGAESMTLVFDKEGKFVMKAPAPKPAAPPAAPPAAKKDSVPAKPAPPAAKPDTAAAKPAAPAPAPAAPPAAPDTTKK